MQHITITRGGLLGHWSRRLIHVVYFIVFPLCYYLFSPTLAAYFGCSSEDIVYVLITLVAVLELCRLKMKWQLFAMREYEKQQISAAAWGVFAVFLVVLYSPSPAYAYALCWTAAVVDPLVGELKSRLSIALSYWSALFVAVFIWLLCWWFFEISIWSVVVCAPLAVLCEYPSWRFIDDNFTIVVGPLLVLSGGVYFFS